MEQRALSNMSVVTFTYPSTGTRHDEYTPFGVKSTPSTTLFRIKNKNWAEILWQALKNVLLKCKMRVKFQSSNIGCNADNQT